MPGGRRGLVAPQNTFLENIIRRSSSQRESPHSPFVLASVSLFFALFNESPRATPDLRITLSARNSRSAFNSMRMILYIDFTPAFIIAATKGKKETRG